MLNKFKIWLRKNRFFNFVKSKSVYGEFFNNLIIILDIFQMKSINNSFLNLLFILIHLFDLMNMIILVCY
jgi:hypothetical protein